MIILKTNIMKNTLKLFALVAFMFAAFATSAQILFVYIQINKRIYNVLIANPVSYKNTQTTTWISAERMNCEYCFRP